MLEAEREARYNARRLRKMSTIILWCAVALLVPVVIGGFVRIVGTERINVIKQPEVADDCLEYGKYAYLCVDAPEVGDIVYLNSHFYRVTEAEEYEAFTDYKCTDDSGNETDLRYDDSGKITVVRDSGFYHFMIYGAKVVALILVAIIMILEIIHICIDRKAEKMARIASDKMFETFMTSDPEEVSGGAKKASEEASDKAD